MKKCTKCLELKEDFCFNKNKNRYDGLQTKCRNCDQSRSKEYYHSNQRQKVAIKLRSKKKLKEFQDKICEYLVLHPCVDCGEKDILVLEFDHLVPEEKVNSVSSLTSRGSWSSIEKEIKKCVVRCANCHRRKTAKQFNFYRLKWLSSSKGRATV